MTDLKPCPVCGNRVDILMKYCGEDGSKARYFFSHHPGPSGFCILQSTLDGKLFTRSRIRNFARIWNVRGEDCHTIGHITEIEEVEFE